MGHHVNRARATQDLEAVPYSNNDGSPKLEVTSHGIHLGVPDGHPLALLIDPSTNIMSRLLLSALPEAQTHVLFQFYVLPSQFPSQFHAHQRVCLSSTDSIGTPRYVCTGYRLQPSPDLIPVTAKVLHKPTFISDVSEHSVHAAFAYFTVHRANR